MRQQVGIAIGHEPQGSVCLLTQPRSWGLAFNPVSFFYCHEADGQLAAIVCEVTNTVARALSLCVASARTNRSAERSSAFRGSQGLSCLAVSARDLEYRMSFSPAAQTLGVHMADWQGEHKLFDATLNLQRETLDRQSLHRYLRRFPWMTAKTALAIYWQAVRLLFKRAPIFSHQAADGGFQTAAALQEHRHEIL